MNQVRDAAVAAGNYLRRNPGEIARTLRNALGLRVGVPLDVFRWLAEQAERQGKLEQVVITPRSPGVHFSAILDAMRTPVRASAALYIERVNLDAHELRVELRVEDVSLELVGDSDSPVALLIKSGALDVSRPGNLVRHVPNLPAFIVDSRENRIVLDLLKHPKITNNAATRSAIALVTSLLTVHGVEFDRSHVDVSFRAIPRGVFSAANAVRKHLVSPSIRRVRLMLPGTRQPAR
ncbi:MAG: hypothetical protein R3A78_13225 [Polyangiales bacterium]|nr:hypothetical protein [Myxococcales bacterium]